MLVLHYGQQVVVLESIPTAEDAKIIFQVVENERLACEKSLTKAVLEAEEARQRVYEAEQQMKQADLQVGKTQVIIQKSGFTHVLYSLACKTLPLMVEIRSKLQFNFTTFTLLNYTRRQTYCVCSWRHQCNSGLIFC